MRLDDDIARLERLAQDVDTLLRLGIAAHEDVNGRKLGVRPAMDRDMALREHGHPRHSALRREVMQVNMQQRSASYFNTTLQRAFDVLEIIKPPSTHQIYEKVVPGKSNAVALDEEVVSLNVRYVRSLTMIFLLGGA